MSMSTAPPGAWLASDADGQKPGRGRVTASSEKGLSQAGCLIFCSPPTPLTKFSSRGRSETLRLLARAASHPPWPRPRPLHDTPLQAHTLRERVVETPIPHN